MPEGDRTVMRRAFGQFVPRDRGRQIIGFRHDTTFLAGHIGAGKGLVDGGEIGQFVRVADRSAIRLRPRECWSQSFCIPVGIITSNCFPMAIFLGHVLLSIYNDSYEEVAAERPPQALGRSARGEWPEGWDFNRPMLQVGDVTAGEGPPEAPAFQSQQQRSTGPSLRDLAVVVHTTSSNPRNLAFCCRAGANACHLQPTLYVVHLVNLLDLLNNGLNRVVLPECEDLPS